MTDTLPISEHDYQVQLILWCDLMARHKYPMLKWIYAVPNGGARHKAVAGKLKAEGVKAGVPDLCLPYPTENLFCSMPYSYHGLYIEMKSKDTKGRVSENQKEWLDYLDSVGYKVAVAWNFDEAVQIIEDYLGESQTSP